MNIKYEGLNHFTAEDARKRSYRSEIDRIIEYLNMCASRGLFYTQYTSLSAEALGFLTDEGYTVTPIGSEYTISWYEGPEETRVLACQALIRGLINPIISSIQTRAENQEASYVAFTRSELAAICKANELYYGLQPLQFVKEVLESLGYECSVNPEEFYVLSISWELENA
jgi:hypothetical protein